MNKYNARKTVVDGITFDSKAEARRYGELKIMEGAGIITDLELQPKFDLIPATTDANGKRRRKCTYRADFMYTSDGKRIVEDVKGVKTEAFKIKEKLFAHLYPELILEIVK